MAAATVPAFRGRVHERQVPDGVLQSARSGRSAVLEIRDEAGIGKAALVRYLTRRASGFRLVGIAGVQAEMELPFAGLHQLIVPMLDGMANIPGHQRAALSVGLGMSAGEPPDRFEYAAAVLHNGTGGTTSLSTTRSERARAMRCPRRPGRCPSSWRPP
jgi:hypothetical protein